MIGFILDAVLAIWIYHVVGNEFHNDMFSIGCLIFFFGVAKICDEVRQLRNQLKED